MIKQLIHLKSQRIANPELNIVIPAMLLSLIAAYILLNSLWKPQLEYLDLTNKLITSKEQIYLNTKNLAANINSLEQQSKALNTNIGNIKNKLTDSSQLSGFLEQLVTIAEDSKIETQSIKPIAQINKDSYFIQPIEIYILANQTSLINFINNLETNSSFLRIENFTIKPYNFDNSKLSVFLRLNAYTSPEGEK